MIHGDTREREKLYEFVVEALRSKSPKQILDVASDDGFGSNILAKAFPAEVVGLDINPVSIDLANSQHKLPNLKFVLGDGRAMAFPDASFDAVVSLHTIEHIEPNEQLKFLRELKRVLSPGGMLLLATPDRDVWVLLGISGMQEGHVGEITRNENEKLLRDAGFSITGTYGQDVVRSGSKFPLRRVLSFIKRLDVFRLRRLLTQKVVDAVDTGTSPLIRTGDVVPLGPDQKASVNVFVCRRA